MTAGLGKSLTALARLDPSLQAVANQHWESANQRFPNDYAVRSGYANSLFAQAMRGTNWQDKIQLFREAMGIYQLDNTPSARRNQALVHKYLSGVYENFDQDSALREAEEAERWRLAVEIYTVKACRPAEIFHSGEGFRAKSGFRKLHLG